MHRDAQKEYKLDKGSTLALHAADYGLVSAQHLRGNDNLGDWMNALRHGPVLAEGHYGW